VTLQGEYTSDIRIARLIERGSSDLLEFVTLPYHTDPNSVSDIALTLLLASDVKT